jgi:hypothetical protein
MGDASGNGEGEMGGRRSPKNIRPRLDPAADAPRPDESLRLGSETNEENPDFLDEIGG